ncbi:MAG: hypothetical protein LBC53_10290 [Spirochaetaceae bacterium]|jgi:hypothetical protein|nr:hypothetical protein [Spirochaetaceae bacterium]
MGYDAFAAARDFLYASGVLLGSALGVFAGAFLPQKKLREKSRNITAALYIFSFFIAVLTVSLCIFPKIISNEKTLIVFIFFVLIFFIAFFFSAVLRFILIFAASVLILSVMYFYYIGYAFDGLKVPIVKIRYSNEDAININPIYNKVNVFKTDSGPAQIADIFYDKRYTGIVKYSFAFIAADKTIPVFGGGRRIVLLSVTMEQVEPGRAVQVFWTKPMEETLLGSALSENTELLNSTSDKIFRTYGLNFLEMQIIYGKAKLPVLRDSNDALLVLQNDGENRWRETWMR